MEQVYQLYKDIILKYELSNYDSRKLWNIIKPICSHPEFIKRCKSPFFHHEKTTLGNHLLSDAVVTYKIIKKIKENKEYEKMIKLETAIYIAMFHDLYEEPWQNNIKNKKFFDKHAFTHPVEAAINAITWFPECFKSKENSLIIIDGIIHHMFPLPVRVVDHTLNDLNNMDKYKALPKKYKDMIEASTLIGKTGVVSFRKTFFVEGRILSKADKLVAMKKELIDINSYLSLLSGRNKKLDALLEQ